MAREFLVRQPYQVRIFLQHTCNFNLKNLGYCKRPFFAIASFVNSDQYDQEQTYLTTSTFHFPNNEVVNYFSLSAQSSHRALATFIEIL